jgi:hypothetical protein
MVRQFLEPILQVGEAKISPISDPSNNDSSHSVDIHPSIEHDLAESHPKQYVVVDSSNVDMSSIQ